MSHAEETYDLALLDQSLAKWRRSSALRAVYGDIFEEVRGWCLPGRTLELGSGIGVATSFIPHLVTSDLVRTRFVDRAVSAYQIPREDWSNLIAMDVLHHLQRPFDFFASAAGALAPGGRIVLVEPAGTPGGSWFYRRFHHEPCAPAEIRPPFQFPADADGGFANMGMGQGLFHECRDTVERTLVELGLRITSVTYRDVLAYPLTGGFSRRALLPAAGLRVLLAGERVLPQALLRRIALRMVIVIERSR